MANFTLTEEQEAIIAHMRQAKESAIFEALAGAAKTTTLVAGAHKLPMVPTASVSFNKKIADEMAKRMPSHITCSTMNSLGHRSWGNTLGQRLNVDAGKMYGVLKDFIDTKLIGNDQIAAREVMASLLRVLRRAKSAGYVPQAMRNLGKSLIEFEPLIDSLVSELDAEPDEMFLHIVEKCLETSIIQAYAGLIDFDDQIYMSTLFGGRFSKFPIVLVDEAQDLSPLNHETLKKMVGGIIYAVGDPWQSIYGFRGADHNSMANLAEMFNISTKLSLSTSFRCPKAVVERARRRVPHMNYPDWAKEGEVRHLPQWTADDVPEHSAIICRNNAPLFQVAMRMIRAGRNVKMKSEIGPAMIKLLAKMGAPDTEREAVFTAIRSWRDAEIAKARESRHAIIQDRAECLMVFAEQSETLAGAIAFAEHLFASAGTVQLMTGHGAKGLEFDVVFHLDYWRIPSKYAKRAADEGDMAQMEQELNLRYVIETRAKDKMFLCNLEDFV